ncbi:hypothetical protein [Corticicoccus populi]|uniref:Uncharacterized protein n=1 Tax=Corticicoccus populi TaxID=1812821 RepID=A0ABW5WWX9_9STAP
MIKKFGILLTVLLAAGCGSLSEEEITEEVSSAASNVNQYEMEITTSSVDEDIQDNEYSMNIDLENQTGYITSIIRNNEKTVNSELYYDETDVFERYDEEEWVENPISVEDMHASYFIDYEVIAGVLEFIQPFEETEFESSENTYNFSYQTSDPDEAEALLNNWGFIIEDGTTVEDAQIDIKINQDTFYIEDIQLGYSMVYDNGFELENTQSIEYNNYNDAPAVEKPDSLN